MNGDKMFALFIVVMLDSLLSFATLTAGPCCVEPDKYYKICVSTDPTKCITADIANGDVNAAAYVAGNTNQEWKFEAGLFPGLLTCSELKRVNLMPSVSMSMCKLYVKSSNSFYVQYKNSDIMRGGPVTHGWVLTPTDQCEAVPTGDNTVTFAAVSVASTCHSLIPIGATAQGTCAAGYEVQGQSGTRTFSLTCQTGNSWANKQTCVLAATVEKPSCDISGIVPGANTKVRLRDEMDATHVFAGGRVIYTCPNRYEWKDYSNKKFRLDCIDTATLGVPIHVKDAGKNLYYAFMETLTRTYTEAERLCANGKGKFKGRLAMPETMTEVIDIKAWIATIGVPASWIWVGIRQTDGPCDPKSFQYADGRPMVLGANSPFFSPTDPGTNCNEKYVMMGTPNIIGLVDITETEAFVLCEFPLLSPAQDEKEVPDCVMAEDTESPKPCWSSPCGKAGSCKDNGTDVFVCECTAAFTGEHCEISLTGCDEVLTSGEQNKRKAALMSQTTTSTTLVVSMIVLIVIFLILLDFSVQRVFHFLQELSLLLAHALIIPVRSNTLLDSGSFCDPLEDPSFEPITLSKSTCTAVAAVLHYLFLLHFLTLFLESLHNYTTHTMVYNTKLLFSRVVILVLALVAPLIVVMVTVAGFWDTYTARKTCWCNVDSVNFFIEFGMMAAFGVLALILNEASTIRRYSVHPGSNDLLRQASATSARGGTLISILSFGGWFIGVNAVYNNDLVLYSVVSIVNLILALSLVLVHATGSPRALAMLKKM